MNICPLRPRSAHIPEPWPDGMIPCHHCGGPIAHLSPVTRCPTHGWVCIECPKESPT